MSETPESAPPQILTEAESYIDSQERFTATKREELKHKLRSENALFPWVNDLIGHLKIGESNQVLFERMISNLEVIMEGEEGIR